MNLDEAINLCKIRKIKEVDGHQIWLMSDILVKALLPLFVKKSPFSMTGIDIVEGDNFMHDKTIPENEIWILDYIAPEYWKYLICHELTEVKHMKDGLSYNEAHEIADKAEWNMRIDDVIELLKKLA